MEIIWIGIFGFFCFVLGLMTGVVIKDRDEYER